jgi:nicotinamide riboside transporter PnuC
VVVAHGWSYHTEMLLVLVLVLVLAYGWSYHAQMQTTRGCKQAHTYHSHRL